MKSRVITGACASICMLIMAATAMAVPYDESANAQDTLRTGLATAQRLHKQVLVIFGANWCPDCRALDKSLQGSVGKLIESRFVVVKIDVGNFDKNLDLSDRYGGPIKKGIPAAVVLGADNQLLYSTKAGELANARRMSDTGIYDFFQRMVAATP